MKLFNYDGVSCVMTAQEARAIRRRYDALHAEYGLGDRRVMIGVYTSSKSMLGIPVYHPRRFVRLGEMPEIFVDSPIAFNVIHHATDDMSTLVWQVTQVLASGGPHVHGFQLNTELPSLEQLQAIRKAFPELRIIQNLAPLMKKGVAGLELVAVANATAKAMNEEMPIGLITDVLIDASNGRGVPINAETANVWHRAFRSHFNYRELAIGVAGSLGPDKLDPVAELIQTEGVSVDAETNLRNGEDDLDLNLVMRYLEEVTAQASMKQ